MNVFNVFLFTSKPESIIAMKQALSVIGKTTDVDVGIPIVSAIAVIPSDQNTSCSDIRDAIRAVVDVFNDKVVVIRDDDDYFSVLNYEVPSEFKNSIKGNRPKKNFERFDNRHEAFLEYIKEKPCLTYDDGIANGIKIDFSDWCWLPVKPDGIYPKREFGKYIVG